MLGFYVIQVQNMQNAFSFSHYHSLSTCKIQCKLHGIKVDIQFCILHIRLMPKPIEIRLSRPTASTGNAQKIVKFMVRCARAWGEKRSIWENGKKGTENEWDTKLNIHWAKSSVIKRKIETINNELVRRYFPNSLTIKHFFVVFWKKKKSSN